MERVGAAELGLPGGKVGARRVLALGLAEGDAFAEGERFDHESLWLPYTNGDEIDHKLTRIGPDQKKTKLIYMMRKRSFMRR
jgi:hypothetical protein